MSGLEVAFPVDKFSGLVRPELIGVLDGLIMELFVLLGTVHAMGEVVVSDSVRNWKVVWHLFKLTLETDVHSKS